MAGNANSGRRKGDDVWAQAILRAIKRRQEDDPLAIEKLADKLLAKVEEGDVSAIKELGDRLDGKAKQQVTVSGEDGGGIIFTIGRHAAKD